MVDLPVAVPLNDLPQCLRSHQLSISTQLGLGCLGSREPLSLKLGCSGSYSCCELKNTVVLTFPEQTVLAGSSLAHSPTIPPPRLWSLILGGGGIIIDLPFVVATLNFCCFLREAFFSLSAFTSSSFPNMTLKNPLFLHGAHLYTCPYNFYV